MTPAAPTSCDPAPQVALGGPRSPILLSNGTWQVLGETLAGEEDLGSALARPLKNQGDENII